MASSCTFVYHLPLLSTTFVYHLDELFLSTTWTSAINGRLPTSGYLSPSKRLPTTSYLQSLHLLPAWRTPIHRGVLLRKIMFLPSYNPSSLSTIVLHPSASIKVVHQSGLACDGPLYLLVYYILVVGAVCTDSDIMYT